MTASIRTFLLINLVVSVVLITSLSLLANLFLENRDLQSHLDDKLTQSAFAIQAFMSQNPTPKEVEKIQAHINAIPMLQYPSPIQKYISELDSASLAFQFQVFDESNRLMLQSSVALPPTFISAPIGLSRLEYLGKSWRVFHTVDPVNKVKVIVAEQYQFRNLLTGHVTQESVLVLLMSYPFLALLIWIIVGKSLSSLQKISEEVQQRAADHLEPMDISQAPVEIKAIIEEWNKLFERLKQGFEREKRFAADAAHELKTPLAAIRAHTHVAMNATNEEERQHALQKIKIGVDRSTHVIQQLLTLSRMGHGLVLEQTTSVNIVRQAKEIVAELAPEVLEKNSEIELIAPENEPIIQGHSTAIAILIRNLVDNAIRYTPEGSYVRVIVEDHGEHGVVLKVVDNGPGIPEYLRDRVFQRFFRVWGNKETGSGLGLGIVQQIAEVHQAKIILETPAEGKGLAVCIAFPKH